MGPAPRTRSRPDYGVARPIVASFAARVAARRGAARKRPRPRLLVAVGLVDRTDAGHDRFLRALVQALAPALDRREELVEVDLERREDRVGPVFHLEPGLARLAASFLDDLDRLVLRQLDDLGLRGLH